MELSVCGRSVGVKGIRRTRWGVFVGIGMTAAVVACQRTHPVPEPAAVATPAASVPVEPPDSEPSWLYADSNLTSDPRLAWRFVRGTIMLRFKPGTAQLERQTAIDTIRGRVVGGIRFRGRSGDGLYIVQVPAGESNAALFEAIALLNRLPQVDTAYPRTVMAGGA